MMITHYENDLLRAMNEVNSTYAILGGADPSHLESAIEYSAQVTADLLSVGEAIPADLDAVTSAAVADIYNQWVAVVAECDRQLALPESLIASTHAQLETVKENAAKWVTAFESTGGS